MPLPIYEWTDIVRREDLTFVDFTPFISHELRPRHLELGSWVIEIPWSGDFPDDMDSGGVPFWESATGQLFTPNAGVVFVCNNETVMSGPVVSAVRSRDDTGAYTLQIAGVDDLVWLARRRANPEPSTAVAPYVVDTHDIYPALLDPEEPAETVIKHYVDVNAGPSAIAARQITGLTIAPDLGRGTAIRARARFPNLLDLVFDLAAQGGLGVSCIQTAQGELTFDVYEPADKTASVKFSDRLGNLGAYEYAIEAPTATHVTIGAADEGTSRVFLEDEVVSPWGRIEGWLDQRQTDDTTELQQAADEYLAENADRFSLSAKVVDTGQHQWAPVASPTATSYDRGDTVAGVIDGVEVPEIIREIQITHDTHTSIVPLIGTRGVSDPDDRQYEELVRAILALERRVDYGERR